MKALRLIGFFIVFSMLSARATAEVSTASAFKPAWVSALSLDDPPKFFYTPSPQGRQPFADLLDDAKVSVRLYMYRLTDSYMIASLKKAAARGVKVEVLMDPSRLKESSMQKTMKDLVTAGAFVRGGSPLFTMTHAKTLVVDEKSAIVSTMNLTWTFRDNRGFGVVTHDHSAIAEIVKMFDVDWRLAAGETVMIPPVSDANLLWTPANSESKLMDLARMAQQKIEILVENLGATPLLDELIAAASRGVKVSVIVPLCTTSSTPLHNFIYIQKLRKGRVEVRNVPLPHSETQPYSHAKMMSVDGKFVYLGSMNFSKNSLQNSRELGIIINDETLYAEIHKIWEQDWNIAVAPPAQATPQTCPTVSWR